MRPCSTQDPPNYRIFVDVRWTIVAINTIHAPRLHGRKFLRGIAFSDDCKRNLTITVGQSYPGDLLARLVRATYSTLLGCSCAVNPPPGGKDRHHRP